MVKKMIRWKIDWWFIHGLTELISLCQALAIIITKSIIMIAIATSVIRRLATATIIVIAMLLAATHLNSTHHYHYYYHHQHHHDCLNYADLAHSPAPVSHSLYDVLAIHTHLPSSQIL